MPSQFFGLNIAYSGLLASNAALNTTANNIANVQTQGYSRQQIIQQASTPLRVYQKYGCAGAGVDTIAIERVRDDFYDQKYWNNNKKVGEYTIKKYYMEQLENYFDDDGKATGFNTIFTQLMSTGLQEWMKNPDSASTKEQFVGYASALSEYFNNLYGNLQETQKDVNNEIKLKVDEINSLAGEIATLNTQINVIEMTGVKANELRDRRVLLLDQLSEIVDIEATETPMIDPNNPDRVVGSNRFEVKIAGGQILVDTGEYTGLECVARKSYEKVNQTDADGLFDVYWTNAEHEQFSLYNGSLGGSLQGLIDMRDGNNGQSFEGMVMGLGNSEDGKRTVSVNVDKPYLWDLNKCNLSDQGGIITLGNRDYYYDSWEYNFSYDADGKEVYQYTFTISDNVELNEEEVTNDRIGKEAYVGVDLQYQGLPYYMSQINEWVRSFSQKFNDILESGYDSYDNPGSALFTGDNKVEGTEYLFEDEFRYDKVKKNVQELAKTYVEQGMSEADALARAKSETKINVKATDVSYYRLTASNFTVRDAMIADPKMLANRKDSADGVEQNDLLEELKVLAYGKDSFELDNSSASEFLQGILSDIALNASRANIFYDSFSAVEATIDTQRMSISGVDEDEEAMNMVKFQYNFNLASKMIQTLTEIYDRLILQTGV